MATDATKAWLQLHGRGERMLGKVLRGYFKQQAAGIVAGLRDFTSPTAAAIPQVFQEADQHEALMKLLAEPLLGMICTGAERVWAAHTAPRRTSREAASAKAFDLTSFDFERFELPEYVIDAIRRAWVELESQSYWQEIQSSTADHLTGLIEQSIEAGHNGWQMMKVVQSGLGEIGRVRAKLISRTETTLAYNAGHEAAYAGLEADGVELVRKWLAVVDGDTRESHAEANGQAADAATKEFTVGGEKCRYPGDAGLSAAERVNCRCTTVAEF